MSYDDIRTACVIRYPYLWAREAHRDETEGRKDRPVAVGIRVSRPQGDLLLLFPITTKEPEAARFAREIPTIEKRRAGLDPDRESGYRRHGYDTRFAHVCSFGNISPEGYVASTATPVPPPPAIGCFYTHQ